ncbi:MAG: NAD(P)H-dependent oxidoreductase subunit E [Chloracidobacterium sp.]|nr:NAD(P)H-dependent oxidoreductase subunit E [Chloracidobacterium sp.]
MQICKTLSCKIMGGPTSPTTSAANLGIHPGDTTEDGKFTVSLVECLGSCGTAPMMQIGFDYPRGPDDREGGQDPRRVQIITSNGVVISGVCEAFGTETIPAFSAFRREYLVDRG